MPALVPTLSAALALADRQFRAGRMPSARRHYVDLLERAQDRTDRATEVVARAMLAWCALRARDIDGAREALHDAAHHVDPRHLDSYARYRKVLARLAMEDSGPQTARTEVLSYLQWAEGADRPAEALDACLLIARLSEADERQDWLLRGIDLALAGDATEDLGAAYTELGAALDQSERHEAALDAYRNALEWHTQTIEADPDLPGARRRVVAAGWATGASACRNESWPEAREHLETALDLTEKAEDCGDLQAWILADLAQVYEAAGDVVEARRLVLRALSVAAEQELAALWPSRYAALRDHARSLELDA